MTFPRYILFLAACGLACPAAAIGPLSSCTLTLTTPGKIAMSGNGQIMSSQENGGFGAVMLVASVNLTPKLTFTPLSVVGPVGWAGAPTSYLSVDTLGGQHIPFTASAFSLSPSIVADTLTFNAKIVNPAGFRAGSYNAAATVTCEAA